MPRRKTPNIVVGKKRSCRSINGKAVNGEADGTNSFRGNLLKRSNKKVDFSKRPSPYKPVPAGQKRRGRKPTPIDWDKVTELAADHCTVEEIAEHFGIARQSLAARREFPAYYKKGYHEGNISLRRLQFAIAESGNPTMLIWLDKQWLNQSDRPDQRMSGPDGGPMQVQQADLSKLTTDELLQLQALLKKCGVPQVRAHRDADPQ